MDFITFEPKDKLRFIKKSSSRNLDETGSPKNESYAKSIITINNGSSDQYVGFKIKTTSPQNFCVRPSVGKISPNNKADVSIYIKVQNKTSSISSDKFLIQTTVIPKEIAEIEEEQQCIEKIGEIFKKIKKDPSILKEHKLLCDISGLPNIKPPETKKSVSLASPESPNPKDNSVASPISPNVTSPVKRHVNTASKLKDTELLEKNPQNITEANAIIKELESAIQKYSVDNAKADLIKTRRYGKESLNETSADGKKEIKEPKELFFEWNEKTAGKLKFPLNKSVQWPIAFIIVVIAFIIGAYTF